VKLQELYCFFLSEILPILASNPKTRSLLETAVSVTVSRNTVTESRNSEKAQDELLSGAGGGILTLIY